MKILVTGADGFIGRNLIAHLNQMGQDIEIFKYNGTTSSELLEYYGTCCDFVFHLAGVNRPEEEEAYMRGNAGFTHALLELLERCRSKAPVVVTSSVQAVLSNPYGKSKKAMEDIIFAHAQETGRRVYVYRLPDVFGKWCKPNYSNAIATFCHRIARNLSIEVNDRDEKMQLVYIDDVVKEFMGALRGDAACEGTYSTVKEVYTESIGKIVDILQNFRDSRENFYLPCLSDSFTRKLYSTYISCLPPNRFDSSIMMHTDDHGSFSEFFRSSNSGQLSTNVTKPGVIKGNHWHHSKTEKFMVVCGEGIIRLRRLYDEPIIEYHVDEKDLRVVDIPAGYIHHIENTGNDVLVTLIWSNECFDPEKPDTYPQEL